MRWLYIYVLAGYVIGEKKLCVFVNAVHAKDCQSKGAEKPQASEAYLPHVRCREAGGLESH